MKKKVLIIVTIAVAIIAIGAIIYMSLTLNKKNNEEDKHLINISISELQEKVANKESFVLVISSTECSHCENYIPKVKRVLTKYDLVGYDISINKLTYEERGLLKDIANTEGIGTPVTVFIINGEEIRTSARLNGDTSETNLENRLRQLEFIE